jgi:hypothetical protein
VEIIFNERYNQLTVLPKSVKTVFFGKSYNQDTIVPGSFRVLSFGEDYNSSTTFQDNVEDNGDKIFSFHNININREKSDGEIEYQKEA